MKYIILLSFCLSGCVTSYQHLSDPRVNNDGYDLVCQGASYDVNSFRFRGNVCKNIAPNGGEFLHTSVEYLWNE